MRATAPASCAKFVDLLVNEQLSPWYTRVVVQNNSSRTEDVKKAQHTDRLASLLLQHIHPHLTTPPPSTHIPHRHTAITTMESDECETHQRFQHMPSSGSFGSHLGGRGEPDGGMLEDDEDLQRLERHLEGSMEGVEEVGSNFLAKARQGLASLKRSLSGGGQEEAEERAGGGKMDVPIGRKGYGADPSSELEQDMHSKMQEAAKALMDATARIKDDTRHLHAPELYHPEAVTSYEEMEGARWAAGATGALDVGRMMKAAIDATESMKGDMGSYFEGEGEMRQGKQRNNSLINEAVKERVEMMDGGGIDKKTEEEKERDEDEMLEMLQMFTPE